MSRSLTVALLVVALIASVALASIPNKSSLRFSEITEEKLAPHSISNSKLQRHAVGTTNVQDGAITSDKIGLFAINERHISPNSITAKSLAVEEITILLRADDYFIDDNQLPGGLNPFDVQGFAGSSSKTSHPARTLLKPADMRTVGTVENHYVSPDGFYYAYGRASGPGIILGWYPSLNGHLLRYQADRALRDLSCNAVHTRDQYVRKYDYNMADYTTGPSASDANGRLIPPDFSAAGMLTSQVNFENNRREVIGPLELTAVHIPPADQCVDNPLGTMANGGTGSLGDLQVNSPFANTQQNYKGLSYTHRSDPYSGNTHAATAYCFDEQERQALGDRFGGGACSCTINNPDVFDSAALFVHSRVWNPNNRPYATPTTQQTIANSYAVPVLQNSPVQDTWMLVHRYQDIGFFDKCLTLAGTINGEDNVKCRQTQIWVDREYQSNYNQYATIIPSYPYSAASATTNSLVLLERGATNIRSRDIFDRNTGTAILATGAPSDQAGSLDNVYPYLICKASLVANQPFYDRGIPFAVPVDPFHPLPTWTSEFGAVTGFAERHSFCFVDGWRDRFPNEADATQRAETANSMFDNMPPERCSTYTNVGDLRHEGFDPDFADIPGPAEGTPVYSPSLERIEINNKGTITIGFAGRGLPGTTQPDIAITVVVLLNSGVQYQNVDPIVGGATIDTSIFP